MSKDSTFKLPSQRQRELLASATIEYSRHVETALPYLTSRGITAEQAYACQYGYVETPQPGHERMQGRLCIPYLTPAGPVSLKFRCIECTGKCEGHIKYDQAAGEGTFLYGVESMLADSDLVCLTEGELDRDVLVHQVGVPAVGVSGATKWQSHWRYCFERFEQVVVFLDGDVERTASDGKKLPPASRVFQNRIAQELDKARFVQLPEGEDVNSIAHSEGPHALRERAGLK